MSSEQVEIGKYPLKIIQPCFGRAGSVSLAKALNILGYGPTWHTMYSSYTKNKKGMKWWFEHDMDNKMDNNTITANDIDGWLNHIECNVVMDAPIGIYWQIFIKYYPNALVIITIRDYEEIYKSQKKVFSSIILTKWYSVLCYFLKEAHWSKHVLLPKYFKQDQWTMDEFMKSNSKVFGQKCDQKIEIIKQLVPKHKLLIFNVKNDGWKPLCEFLHVPIPNNIPFPHKNKGKTFKKKVWTTLLGNNKKYVFAVSVIAVVVGTVVIRFAKKKQLFSILNKCTWFKYTK